MFDPAHLSQLNGNLGLIQQANFPCYWGYRTTDNAATVTAADYFPFSSGIRIKDVIWVFIVDTYDVTKQTTSEVLILNVVGT